MVKCARGCAPGQLAAVSTVEAKAAKASGKVDVMALTTGYDLIAAVQGTGAARLATGDWGPCQLAPTLCTKQQVGILLEPMR